MRTPSPPPPSPFPPTETDDNKDNFAKPPLSPQAALAPVLATLIDKLEWLNDPLVGSQIALKGKMMNPSTWADEIVLQLTSNLLEVDINVITAFNDVTNIKPIDVTSWIIMVF